MVGTHLEDGDGNTIYLVGTQVDWNERIKVTGTSSTASSPYESWFTETDIAAMKAAGANYVEVHIIPFTYIMPTKNVLNTDYFEDWLDVWIDWATKHKMYISIDIKGFSGKASWAVPYWIWAGAGYPEPTTDAEWNEVIVDFFDTGVSAMDSNRAAFANAWALIANRYKDNPYVLFSIINEPFMGFDTMIADQVSMCVSYAEVMEQVIDAIHATGATNVIIVNRPYTTRYQSGYGNIYPVDRTGIIWEDHYYMGSTHSYDLWKSYIDMYVAKIVKTFGKPLIIGEYGYDPQDYGKIAFPSTWKTYLQNQVKYLDTKGLCGRQWHNWGVFEGEYYDYVFDYYTSSESQDIFDIVN